MGKGYKGETRARADLNHTWFYDNISLRNSSKDTQEKFYNIIITGGEMFSLMDGFDLDWKAEKFIEI